MGYGTEGELCDCLSWRLRSGDGGLDGKIDRDKPGISQIYIQAKRYAEDIVVGHPTVQSFVGALVSRGATVGVFFTTNRFSAEATDTSAAKKKFPRGLWASRLLLHRARLREGACG